MTTTTTRDQAMGKGDPKTKRGKIFKKSYGKSRPKPSKVRARAKEKAKTA